MGNTYSINVTRGQEFAVRDELEELGLHPWVPMRRDRKLVKEAKTTKWYDAPYAEKVMFCVIPAIYWLDVRRLKHVIGKPLELSRMDIQGAKIGGEFRPGLVQFREAVEREYRQMQDYERALQRAAERGERLRAYECQYKPGDALEVLTGAMAGHTGVFREVIQQAHDKFARLRLEMEMLGGPVPVDVDPDQVRAAG